MDEQKDFQAQFGNNVVVTSLEDYQTQVRSAGCTPITTDAELQNRLYRWQYGEWSHREWMALTREQRVEQVFGAALVRFLKERQSQTRRPAPAQTMVKCDCGHTVAQGQRMNASRGTSCPNCYDRMS